MSDTATRSWEIRSSRYLIRRWWMRLRVDHVVLPDGTEMPEFHVVEYPDWVCTVCVAEDGRFVLVEQYRHGIGRPSLELPAGAVDAGESPADAARRELLEETGYVSDDWHEVGVVAPEPSKHTNWAHLYVALSARSVSTPERNPREPMIQRLMHRDELRAAIGDGRLVHGVHLGALHRASALGLIDDV